MTTHEAARIRGAFCCCKCWTIHQIAAVSGQCHAVARLHIAGARLGVLTRKSTDASNAAAATLHQYQAHLQQDLQARGDRARLTAIEGLCAIAAL